MADDKSSDAPESESGASAAPKTPETPDTSAAPESVGPPAGAEPGGATEMQDGAPAPEQPTAPSPADQQAPPFLEREQEKAEEAAAPPPDYGTEPGTDDEQVRGDFKSRTESIRARTGEATAKMRGATEEATAKMRGAAATAQETTREHMTTARTLIGESEGKTLAIAAYVLNLAVAVTGIGPLAAVILAYVKRDDADPVVASHVEFQIRTFWIGLATMIIGIALLIVVVGALILFALAVWWLLRNVVGLIRLMEGKPMPDPKAWLF